MKIFFITHNKWDYNCYLGHVIVANNETEVRELSKKNSASEGIDIWDNATVTVIGEYTGNETKPFILLSDFRAG